MQPARMKLKEARTVQFGTIGLQRKEGLFDEITKSISFGEKLFLEGILTGVLYVALTVN